MATVAAAGALSGVFADSGISRSFMNQVGESVVEGSSALFLIANDYTLEKLKEAARQESYTFETVSTKLSKDELERLLKDFDTRAQISL